MGTILKLTRKNIIFEPVTLVFLLGWLVKLLIGFILIWGTINIVDAVTVEDLGKVTIDIKDVSDKEDFSYTVKNLDVSRTDTITRLVDFDIKYDWSDRVDIGHRDKITDILLDGLENGAEKLGLKDDRFSVKEKIEFSSAVTFDPDKGNSWDVVWIDKIARGTITIEKPDGTEEEMKFEVVIFTELDVRKTG